MQRRSRASEKIKAKKVKSSTHTHTHDITVPVYSRVPAGAGLHAGTVTRYRVI
jgi:hypothetical protein